MKKIFNNDTNLPYRSTDKTPLDSKRDIDGCLARYGIFKIMWTWDLEGNKVQLVFELSEDFKDTHIHALVRMNPPTIWKKPKRGKPDNIDWKLSMRIFFWHIKNLLAMTYAMQSEKTLAFLSHIAVNETVTIGDVIVPRLEEIQNLKALPRIVTE